EEMGEFDPIQQIVQPTASVRRQLAIDTFRIGAQRLAGPEVIPEHEEGGVLALQDQFGCKWELKPGEDHYYNMKSSPLSAFTTIGEGLRNYRFPAVASATSELTRVMEKQRRDIGDSGVVADRNSAGLTEVAFRVRGYEQFFMDMALDPAGASELMERILQYKLDYWSFFAEYARETGLAHEVLVAAECDDLGTQNSLLFSPEMIRNVVMPLQRRLIAHIKHVIPGVKVLYHSDGAIFDLIPELINIGVDILNPVQFTASGMSLERLKCEFGREIVFWGGGVDTQETLPHGTPQQVADEVKRNIDILAPGGGFVFAAVHNIQADVPPENFWAMWDTIQNYPM
ncbi:MAG: uroporphyrinogen decarboxylase family protein, partial [Spirochaetota bacterium]